MLTKNGFNWKRSHNKATSIQGLAEILYEFFNSFARNKREEVLQICGPMSTGGLGNFEDNMRLFNFAVEKATENGLLVFNQIPFQGAMIRIIQWEPGQPYCVDLLEVFYRKVLESGLIHRTLFLPDLAEFQRSSIWERELVKRLGIVADEFPVHWLYGLEVLTLKGGES